MVLIVAIGALMVASPLLIAKRQGSDDRAAQAIEAAGHNRWMEPVNPPSASTEPWLFAVQALIGAALLGFVLLRRRS